MQELNYKIGLGDLNGDSQTDFVVLAWWERNDGANLITQKIYAYLSDGTYLWTVDTKINKGADNFDDPMTTVSMNVWDLDHDGKCEVITQIQEELVILDGMNGQVLNSVHLWNPEGFIYSTIAFFGENDPAIVVAHGRDLVIRAFDRDLKQLWEFTDPLYKRTYGPSLKTWDIDDDGSDEVISGPLVLDSGGKLKFSPLNRYIERSFIHDFDPLNPGYEQFLFVGSFEYGSDEWIGPRDWKGAYLFGVSNSSVLWHDGGDSLAQTGWGRPHRGWIAELDTSAPGLELYFSGIYWRNDEYQRYLNGEYDDGVRPWGKIQERDFIFSAQGTLLEEIPHIVGYPVQWDHDPEAEVFFYRDGILRDGVDGPILADTLAQAYGSGEALCVDIRGDHREEILLGSYDQLIIYSNGAPEDHNLPSPRLGHQYRLNLARTASGFWKPQPIDPRFTQPDSLHLLAPNGGELLQSGTVDTIQWYSTGMIATIRIDYSLDAGNAWLTIADSVSNTGTFYWQVPHFFSSRALVRVSHRTKTSIFDISDTTFTILGDSLYYPVELSAFHASKISENTILLQWHTESELDNYGFVIERKRQSRQFHEIGFVPGNRTSSEPHDYSFIDTVSVTGRYTYRLKQIDTNGHTVLSHSIQVSISLPHLFRLHQNYPNPFNGETILSFRIPNNDFVKITVYNLQGEKINTIFNKWLRAGFHRIRWEGRNPAGGFLPSGTYYIEFKTSRERRLLKTLFLK